MVCSHLGWLERARKRLGAGDRRRRHGGRAVVSTQILPLRSVVNLCVFVPSSPGSQTHQSIANHASSTSTEQGQAVQLRCGIERWRIFAVAIPIPATVPVAVSTRRSRDWRGVHQAKTQ